jgi:hypothetical protein
MKNKLFHNKHFMNGNLNIWNLNLNLDFYSQWSEFISKISFALFKPCILIGWFQSEQRIFFQKNIILYEKFSLIKVCQLHFLNLFQDASRLSFFMYSLLRYILSCAQSWREEFIHDHVVFISYSCSLLS